MYAPSTIGTIATSASGPGSWPSVIAATTSAKSGAIVSSGDVRAAPIRRWLRFRNVQPRRKCTTPAAAKAISGHAPACSSCVRSSVASDMASSASAAITRLMNVET